LTALSILDRPTLFSNQSRSIQIGFAATETDLIPRERFQTRLKS
jgi:hypothetical protein